MLPLVGGGYGVALLQVSLVYYVAAAVLHYVVPALVSVQSVQHASPKPGQVRQEALRSIGARAVGGRLDDNSRHLSHVA